MAIGDKITGLREVNVTTARNLSPIFDEAVRKEQPVIIRRGNREHGLLVARDQLLRLLAPYRFHVDVLPEEKFQLVTWQLGERSPLEDNTHSETTSGFTLWLNELEVGGHGASLAEARADLLSAVRAYVANYLREFDFYRHLPDLARLEPYVLRIALTRDDRELIDALFGEGASDRS